MRLLPAIDLLKGRVVTLVGGKPGTQTTELSDPMAVYERWVREGAEWVHVIDLDAAFGKGDHRLVLERILEDGRAKVQVGGGLRDLERVKWCLDRGASTVVVGTRAVEEPAWLAEMSQQYPDQVVVAVDARQGRVVTRGWTRDTGKDVVELTLALSRLPLAGLLFTSVDVEGKLEGIDHDAVVQVHAAARLPLIVAGGVTSYDDLKFLKGLGVDGVVLGAALYQDRIRFERAKSLVEDL